MGTALFTSAGSPASQSTGIPGDVTSAGYVVTLVYTISWQTFAQDDHGNVSASIGLSTTPLPAAVWMFGSVLAGAGGIAGWNKRRKAA